MILFPAIDLKDGRCVRLKLGDMATATVYNEDPAAQAKSFEDQGFDDLEFVRRVRARFCPLWCSALYTFYSTSFHVHLHRH